jgi:hypothetical protein
MKKVVINGCFGGFGLSPEATLKLHAMGAKGLEVTHVDEYWPLEKRAEEAAKYRTMGYDYSLAKWREYLADKASAGRGLFLTVFSPDEQHVIYANRVERDDPNLIKVVEEMGDAANGACAKLEIVEIPDDAQWEISEYDGNEHVAEQHRTWR